MPLLVRSEILRLFVNTLTADDKYPYYSHYNENFTLPIELQLFETPKAFSQNFIAFCFSIVFLKSS